MLAKVTKKPAPTAKVEDNNVYNYLNYREYLKDVFTTNKQKYKYFNYSHFAKTAGIGSHSYLRMVINGERNLSAKTIHKFAMALELSKKETAYFESMALFTQSTTESERDHYFDRLVHLRPRKFTQVINEDQYEYFNNRHYVTLHEMVVLKNFHEDNDWIGKCLHPPMKPMEVAGAFAVLVRLGLLKRDENGKLAHTNVTLTAAPEMNSLEIYAYNRQILSEGKDAILNRRRELVELVSVTAPIPKKLLPDIKQILLRCKDEIVNLINREKSGYDEIYQFNLQYFPLTSASADPPPFPDAASAETDRT